jgi:tRNA dimethylallyltransferase
MIAAGLLEEVERILKMGPDKTPLQAIGYKEVARYFKGEITRDEAVRLVKRNCRRYAKRQFTWFRKEEEVIWIDVTGVFHSEKLSGMIKELLARLYPEEWGVSAKKGPLLP